MNSSLSRLWVSRKGSAQTELRHTCPAQPPAKSASLPECLAQKKRANLDKQSPAPPPLAPPAKQSSYRLHLMIATRTRPVHSDFCLARRFRQLKHFCDD